MFTSDDIKDKLKRQPFRPLRIIVSEGRQFDIHHPDLVLVGRRELTIGFSLPDQPTAYDRVIWVPMVHVVAIEDISVPTDPSSNGQE